MSNFEPLDHDAAVAMREDAVNFSKFTAPVRDLITTASGGSAGPQEAVHTQAASEAGSAGSQVSEADSGHSSNGHGSNGLGSNGLGSRARPGYFVCSANPRIVDGKPSKNPRYLQVRPDLSRPQETAAAELALHLQKGVDIDIPLPHVVDVVAAGRRNNPPEDGVPALCAFNPLHYLELPELFMEFISSMTGKSPSTTGAGSEGALTKAPFNAMPTTYDLNAALLSYVLTGYDGWISSAGYIGPHVRVDHDISLLVPEVFSRIKKHERPAAAMIRDGFLEKIEDFEYEGRTIAASRLGYRITHRFASTYFGRIFMHPEVVFTPQMLRPEEQDLAIFVDAVDVMVTTHENVAKNYFDDGTAELAVPPLKALLEIMAFGKSADGYTLTSPELRAMFDRENVLASDWYAARLDARQAEQIAQAERGVATLEHFNEGAGNARVVARLDLEDRLASARAELERVKSAEHREALVGTIGRQASFR